jgi:hypothetical protein
MPICFGDGKQILFEDLPDDDDNWVRADVYERHIAFDRGGLCRLTADDARTLARWLLERADALPPQPPPRPRNVRGRYAGRPGKPTKEKQRQVSAGAA